MPAKVVARPKTRPRLQTGTLINGDPSIMSRHLSDLGTAVERIEGAVKDRVAFTVDLAVGANKLSHGLGRTPKGLTLTPTVADVTFAWAMTAADDKQVTVTVLNIAQPGACVEVF